MKCPKCNYISFEYLNECRKCSIDLSAHKSELGIDFPEYSDLDLLSHIDLGGQSEAEAQNEEPAVAVADEEETAEPEEAVHEEVETVVEEETVDADMSDIASGIEITGESDEEGQAEVSEDDSGGINFGGFGDGDGDDETVSIDAAALEEEPQAEALTDEPEGIDLGEIGESTEETASMELPEIEEEPVAEVQAPEAVDVEEAGENDLDLPTEETSEEGTGEIDLDIPGEETAETDEVTEAAPAEISESDEISLGDLEDTTGGLSESQAVDALGSTEDDMSLDLGDVEAGGKTDEGETAADALEDVDLDLGDVESSEDEAPESDTAEEEEVSADTLSVDDLDLDLNMDDDSIVLDDEPDGKKKEKDDDDDDDLGLDDLELELD